VRGKRSISSTYNGVTYFFASETDKEDFDRDPSKFEPQYGGFCANSVAHGRKSDSDPNAFFIYKGKLYVCSTPAAKAEFASNPDANISRADANWLKMGPATYNSQTRGFDEPWPFGPESTQQ
jgi:YHS domain-containing protein